MSYNKPTTKSIAIKKNASFNRIGNSLREQSCLQKKTTTIDFSWVSFFSFFITIFTAVAFAAGKAYRQNYLAQFNITDTLIPWSFQDVTYLGITKQLVILISAPLAAIILIFIILFFSILILWISKKITSKRSNISRNVVIKKPGNINAEDALLDATQFLVNCLGAILLFSFLALLFVGRAETLGGKDAIADIASAKTNKSNLAKVKVERLISGQLIQEEGFLVMCSEKSCGLYTPDNKDGISKLLPQDNIRSFTFLN